MASPRERKEGEREKEKKEEDGKRKEKKGTTTGERDRGTFITPSSSSFRDQVGFLYRN